VVTIDDIRTLYNIYLLGADAEAKRSFDSYLTNSCFNATPANLKQRINDCMDYPILQILIAILQKKEEGLTKFTYLFTRGDKFSAKVVVGEDLSYYITDRTIPADATNKVRAMFLKEAVRAAVKKAEDKVFKDVGGYSG
jgi:hypothetical protein